jgi:alpha-methylacyl-CoA racemase
VTTGAFERPAPAPRFSSSQPTLATMPGNEDLSPSAILARFGFAKAEIDGLVKSGLLTDN